MAKKIVSCCSCYSMLWLHGTLKMSTYRSWFRSIRKTHAMDPSKKWRSYSEVEMFYSRKRWCLLFQKARRIKFLCQQQTWSGKIRREFSLRISEFRQHSRLLSSRVSLLLISFPGNCMNQSTPYSFGACDESCARYQNLWHLYEMRWQKVWLLWIGWH